MKVYNKTLPKEIINELYYLDEAYFQFDRPIPFVNGLTIYPVNVKNHDEFLTCSQCFTLNKMDDPNGISFSNMEYLINKIQSENKDEKEKWSRYWFRMCELIFHIKNNGMRCSKCNKIMSYSEFFNELGKIVEKGETFQCTCGAELKDFIPAVDIRINPKTNKKELRVDGAIINSKNFNRLRQIVMYQNLPDFKDDSWVDIEVRKDQEETRRLKEKKTRMGKASLERKCACMAVKLGVTYDYIYSLSMRKFLMMFSIMDDLINYETTKIGLMTGMVSLKEPPEHWIYKSEDEDIYGKAVDMEAFKNTINNAGK